MTSQRWPNCHKQTTSYVYVYTISMKCFVLKNQTVIDLTTKTKMQRGAYADPWYFTDWYVALMCWGIRSQQGNNKFSYMQHTSRLLAIFAAVLYCGNFKFESGICTFSKRLSSLQWTVLSEYILIFVVCQTSSFKWHRQKFTFGINKPFLGRIKSTENVCLCYGKSSAWADLNGSVTSSKHRQVSSEVLEFLSMLLDFIYIIFAS